MIVDKKVETNGALLRSIYEGCGVFQPKVVGWLSQKGISDIQMNGWYPVHSVLEVFEYLASSVGVNILTEIGKQIPNHARTFPPLLNFESALLSLDTAYKENHRNGDVGHYHALKLEKFHYQMFCDNPYPAKFNLGLLRGMSRKWATLSRIEQSDSAKVGGHFVIKWNHPINELER